MTTTTLTDRYVWATVRNVPQRQRTDLDRELRERIADQRDAFVEEGVDAADAERRTLLELGDPSVLAADYLDRPLQLIGPRYYLTWLRLVKVLMAVVLPIVAAASVLAQLLAGASVGEVFGATFGVLLSTAAHLAFWTTLVFAILERSPDHTPGQEWSLANLPQVRDEHRAKRLPDLIASVVFLAIFAGFIVWGQLGVTIDGESFPVLDPDLWSFWIPWFLGLLVLEMAFAGAIYAWGWNWWLAFANLLLNIAFTVPALWLLLSERLFNPEFLAAIGWPWGDAGGVTMTVIVVAIVGVTMWDVVDGAIKAYRAGRERAIA
ncbi:permease prefix domain 1-containing protein [Agromyces mangrovi Wang et al. 2018]|uniref:permease prefix domain 1-containing protein n=1 Tax=Agromyces mangrovi TaxID=1858653 RepID=UPI002573290F|nr:permease prefix domain 1-containing protein [Agromyces mangrovi]BDZ65715.1 hypothetical protein GCM10025877_26530 [Agromyces mangrovi]